MKIIITGSTGFVGRETVRQSLANPAVTSVVAVARKPVSFTDTELLPESDVSKLVHATVSDYGEYSPDVRAKFAGASACIWTVGLSPIRSKAYDFAEVTRVCQTCTVQGFTAICESGPDPSRPFRFVYMSGMGAEPDQTKKPWFSPQYLLMRGETEYKVHALTGELAKVAKTHVSAASYRFAMISRPGVAGSVFGSLSRAATGLPTLTNVEAAKVLIDQAVNGFYEGKGTLDANDMVDVLKGMGERN